MHGIMVVYWMATASSLTMQFLQPLRGEINKKVRCSLEERVLLWMDEVHFAPPKKPCNNHSPVNNKPWLPMVSKWCRISSIHRIS